MTANDHVEWQCRPGLRSTLYHTSSLHLVLVAATEGGAHRVGRTRARRKRPQRVSEASRPTWSPPLPPPSHFGFVSLRRCASVSLCLCVSVPMFLCVYMSLCLYVSVSRPQRLNPLNPLNPQPSTLPLVLRKGQARRHHQSAHGG
jgi:hypothetical protein